MLKNCKGRSLNGFKNFRMLNNYKRRRNSKNYRRRNKVFSKRGNKPKCKRSWEHQLQKDLTSTRRMAGNESSMLMIIHICR
jgi:hypothetical protein